MKYLAVLFLLGFALAAASPLNSQRQVSEWGVQMTEEDFDRVLEAEKEISLEEVKKQLKERFEEVLNKIKEAIREGKAIQEGFLEKFHELSEKLKNLGLKDQGKDILEKILEKLGIGQQIENVLLQSEGSFDISKLKEKFNDLVSKVKDAFEQGKSIKDALTQLQDLQEKLKVLNIDLGENGKEYLEMLKQKVKDYWKNFKEKLGMKRSADIDVFGMLKELLEELQEELKLKFEGKGKEFLKKILEILGVEQNSIDQHTEKILLESEGGFDIGKLKDQFNDLVNKVKDAFEQGKSIKDTLEQLQDLQEKLKILNIDLGEKGREYLDKLKNKVKDYWKSLKEKLGMKRSADIDVIGMLEELKQLIKEKFNGFNLKELVSKVFKKSSELRDQFMKIVEHHEDVAVILSLINRLIGTKNTQHSVADIYAEIRNYFRDLNIDLKEKFTKFGNWVKNVYEKGLEKGKSKAENIKKIAKEFLKDTREMSKELATEALDFFREHKEDLGKLFDELVEKVKEIRRN